MHTLFGHKKNLIVYTRTEEVFLQKHLQQETLHKQFENHRFSHHFYYICVLTDSVFTQTP